MKLLLKYIIFIALCLQTVAIISLAHGGGTPQLTNEPAGPYRVFAWTSPDPPQEGTVHVTVAIAGPIAEDATPLEVEKAPPVLDAAVNVIFNPVNGQGEVIESFATHQKADNKLNYETDVEIDSAGEWQIVLDINAPAGPAETSFTIQVEPASGTNWWLVGILGAVIIAVALLFFARRRNKETYDSTNN